MFQALGLFEVYFNRLIQHIMISGYNINKSNADKTINNYFESLFKTVNELITGYQQAVLSQNKKFESSEHISSNSAEFESKYKALLAENDALRLKLDSKKPAKKPGIEMEMQTDILEDPISTDPLAVDFDKLNKKINELTEKYEREKVLNEKNQHKITDYEMEIGNLQDEITQIKNITQSPYFSYFY